MRYTLKELFIGYLPRPKRLYRVLQDLDSGGGGGGSYDDTEIKRRMTAVENGKQDKLVAGQNITISANTIAAKNIIDDTKNSLTTVWSSNKVKALFESLEGGVDIVITATRPAKSAAVEKTMYYVGSTAPYHIWFFLNDDWVDFGTTEISLENYYTKAEVDELLDDKVDKETGKVLIPTEDLAQITTNKNDIDDLQEEKQDKITDSALSSIDDSTTVSSVSATDKTNKTFVLSDLWDYIKGKITEVYYPVGAVVLNMGTNPSESFGGTWELLATGTKALYLDSTAGTAVSEELPNIKGGDIPMELSNADGKWKGALKLTKQDSNRSPQWSGSDGWGNLSFDASKSNSVYKNNGKVRAEGITVCAWKRTA